MADELDDEERAAVEKIRAEKKKKAEDDKEVWIKNPDGSEAAVPWSKGRAWLQKTFGIDLDEEPVQEPDAKPGQPEGGDSDKPVRFGRRVS
jgi:hypothetical protein